MEQKIKDLLSSPIEENQRLGCNLAKSVLNWSNFDIIMYVLNCFKGWRLSIMTTVSDVICSKDFLGKGIDFCIAHDFVTEKENIIMMFTLHFDNLVSISMCNRQGVHYFDEKKPDKGLINTFNQFIKQNL